MTNPVLGQALTFLAYVVGGVVLWLDARCRRMATEGMGLVALWGLCSGVLGAKLTEWVLSHPTVLMSNFGSFFDPRLGGRTVIGGVVCGWIAVELAKKRLGIRRSTGDSFALALPAGEFVGRIGCLFNGCCYGVACSATTPGAIWQHNAWRVPTQLLLALSALVTFATIWCLRDRVPREGDAWKLYLLLFGLSRLVIEFWRERQAVALGLSIAQIACLVLVVWSGRRWLWRPQTVVS